MNEREYRRQVKELGTMLYHVDAYPYHGSAIIDTDKLQKSLDKRSKQVFTKYQIRAKDVGPPGIGGGSCEDLLSYLNSLWSSRETVLFCMTVIRAMLARLKYISLQPPSDSVTHINFSLFILVTVESNSNPNNELKFREPIETLLLVAEELMREMKSDYPSFRIRGKVELLYEPTESKIGFSVNEKTSRHDYNSLRAHSLRSRIREKTLFEYYSSGPFTVRETFGSSGEDRYIFGEGKPKKHIFFLSYKTIWDHLKDASFDWKNPTHFS